MTASASKLCCWISTLILLPYSLPGYSGRAEKVGEPTGYTAQPSYVLHSDDEITVRSLQVKEITDKSFRVDQNGEVNFPLIGRVHLAGATVHAAEVEIAAKLKAYYLEPDIAVSISAFHEEPVSVIGAVGVPGVHQMHGQTTLLDILSAAGGVRADAGPVVRVSRESSLYGQIPYPTAHQVAPGTSVVEINLKSLMEASDSSENIAVQPHDVISVPPAEVVYVIGNVKRAGGFALGGKPNLSVLQALSLAEGLDPRAAPKHARILRRESQIATDSMDIPVDIQKILAGKAPDIIMRPNDILFVPSSLAKAVSARTIEAAISIGTGVLIFH